MYSTDPRLTEIRYIPSSRRMYGQLEVCLEVPNLGQAVSFYAALFDCLPAATDGHVVWFDVPKSMLRIELREVQTPTATRLRLWTEPRGLEVLADRMRQIGVAVAQAGPTSERTGRAITFHDPGRNSWELYTSIGIGRPTVSRRRVTGPSWRALGERARAAVAAAAALESRFVRERQRHQDLRLPHSHRTTITRW
jgi:hypothetical protein